jgi:hypothetical protein
MRQIGDKGGQVMLQTRGKEYFRAIAQAYQDQRRDAGGQ